MAFIKCSGGKKELLPTLKVSFKVTSSKSGMATKSITITTTLTPNQDTGIYTRTNSSPTSFTTNTGVVTSVGSWTLTQT